MGIIKLDGFEGYGPDGTLSASDTSLDRRLGIRWGRLLSNYGGVNYSARISGPPLARGGRLCFNLYDDTSKYWRTWLGDRAQLIVGFAFWPTAGQSGDYVYFRHGGTAQGQNPCLRFAVSRNGYVQLYNAANNLIDTTAAAIIRFGCWNYVEIKAVFHNTAGSLELRHNGKTVFTAQNQDLAYAADHNHCDTLEFKFWDGLLYDDVYVVDPSMSGANDFLGPVVVRRLAPTADTAAADFSPSAGTDHYACVNDARADQDAYLESTTVGDDELWDYENLPAEIAAVKGVNIETAAYVTGAQAKKVASLCKSGASVQEVGTAATVSTDWEGFNHILETDPETSSPWTVSGLNAAQFGVRHKAV